MVKRVLNEVTKRRSPETHKGDYGHVFVLAGSTGMTGAAYLASQAALLSGCGLVTLGIPKSLNAIMEVKLTEVMTKPLKETGEGSLALEAFDEIKCFIDSSVNSIAIGPGLSTNKETALLVEKLITTISKPITLDADGINAFVSRADVLKSAKGEVVVTPHPGEMARISGIDTAEIQRDRKSAALDFARKYEVIVVLKGHKTIVADPGGEIFINETGNPGMASGGCGDVLTGMVASLIGQGLKPYNAAKLAVYMHGLAGDIAMRHKGQISLIASDILEALPEAFRSA
ncbi:MAG: NAD(P)H-hydrate dehydratase [Candidatus Omnitrophica bacterium]|nr:NAD(P)H-hydrate dehydratase [Candidatus Omnitrophota bacterium]